MLIRFNWIRIVSSGEFLRMIKNWVL